MAVATRTMDTSFRNNPYAIGGVSVAESNEFDHGESQCHDYTSTEKGRSPGFRMSSGKTSFIEEDVLTSNPHDTTQITSLFQTYDPHARGGRDAAPYFDQPNYCPARSRQPVCSTSLPTYMGPRMAASDEPSRLVSSVMQSRSDSHFGVPPGYYGRSGLSAPSSTPAGCNGELLSFMHSTDQPFMMESAYTRFSMDASNQCTAGGHTAFHRHSSENPSDNPLTFTFNMHESNSTMLSSSSSGRGLPRHSVTSMSTNRQHTPLMSAYGSCDPTSQNGEVAHAGTVGARESSNFTHYSAPAGEPIQRTDIGKNCDFQLTSSQVYDSGTAMPSNKGCHYHHVLPPMNHFVRDAPAAPQPYRHHRADPEESWAPAQYAGTQATQRLHASPSHTVPIGQGLMKMDSGNPLAVPPSASANAVGGHENLVPRPNEENGTSCSHHDQNCTSPQQYFRSPPFPESNVTPPMTYNRSTRTRESSGNWAFYIPTPVAHRPPGEMPVSYYYSSPPPAGAVFNPSAPFCTAPASHALQTLPSKAYSPAKPCRSNGHVAAAKVGRRKNTGTATESPVAANAGPQTNGSKSGPKSRSPKTPLCKAPTKASASSKPSGSAPIVQAKQSAKAELATSPPQQKNKTNKQAVKDYLDGLESAPYRQQPITMFVVVKFKHSGRRYATGLSQVELPLGSYVMVEGDRGVNIGVVHAYISVSQMINECQLLLQAKETLKSLDEQKEELSTLNAENSHTAKKQPFPVILAGTETDAHLGELQDIVFGVKHWPWVIAHATAEQQATHGEQRQDEMKAFSDAEAIVKSSVKSSYQHKAVRYLYGSGDGTAPLTGDVGDSTDEGAGNLAVLAAGSEEGAADDSSAEKCVSPTSLIHLVDCEYQFDRQKLTLFLSRSSRHVFVDFRWMQRKLFRAFRCRIWMAYMDEIVSDEDFPGDQIPVVSKCGTTTIDDSSPSISDEE